MPYVNGMHMGADMTPDEISAWLDQQGQGRTITPPVLPNYGRYATDPCADLPGYTLAMKNNVATCIAPTVNAPGSLGLANIFSGVSGSTWMLIAGGAAALLLLSSRQGRR